MHACGRISDPNMRSLLGRRCASAKALRLALCFLCAASVLHSVSAAATGLAVLAPTATDYTRGRPLEIKISIDVRLPVDVELYSVKPDGRESYVTLASPLPTQTSVGPGIATLVWNVPTDFAAGAYYIRVKIASDLIGNYRSAQFNIIVPSLALPLPASAGGAAVLYTGTAYLWTYSAAGDVSQGVLVDVCPQGTATAAAACLGSVWSGGLPGNNAFSWLVPKSLLSATAKYVLRIVSSIDPAAVGFSPAFGVAAGAVEASLSGQEGAFAALRPLASYTVSWQCTSAYNVRVTYAYGPASAPFTVKEDGGQSGSATVIVPYAAAGAASFVVSVAAYQPSAPSVAAFTSTLEYPVKAARVEWTAPAAGAALAVGETRLLSWSSTAAAPAWEIALRSPDGSLAGPVASLVAGSSYSWTLAGSLPLMSSAVLALSATGYPGLSATLPVAIVAGAGGPNTLAIIVGCSVGGFVLLCAIVVGALCCIARTFVDEDEEAGPDGAPVDAAEYKGARSGWFTIRRGSKTARGLHAVGRSLRRFGFGSATARTQRGRRARVDPAAAVAAAPPGAPPGAVDDPDGSKSIRFGGKRPAPPTPQAPLPALMAAPVTLQPATLQPTLGIQAPVPRMVSSVNANALRLLPHVDSVREEA